MVVVTSSEVGSSEIRKLRHSNNSECCFSVNNINIDNDRSSVPWEFHSQIPSLVRTGKEVVGTILDISGQVECFRVGVGVNPSET